MIYLNLVLTPFSNIQNLLLSNSKTQISLKTYEIFFTNYKKNNNMW